LASNANDLDIKLLNYTVMYHRLEIFCVHRQISDPSNWLFVY